jgi:hypothetical protein
LLQKQEPAGSCGVGPGSGRVGRDDPTTGTELAERSFGRSGHASNPSIEGFFQPNKNKENPNGHFTFFGKSLATYLGGKK